MLRSKLSSSTSEKLLSLGLRLHPTSNAKRCQSCSLVAGGLPRWVATVPSRSFSTGTTGFIKEQSSTDAMLTTATNTAATTTTTTTTTTPLEDGTVLVSAAKEAQRLSDLVARCRPEKQKPSNSKIADIPNARDAAQALLFVTRLSSPLQEILQTHRDNNTNTNTSTATEEHVQTQITSLHRAFLSVTSWCLDLVHLDPSLLELTLQLARRAHQFQLPFHIPLYIRLMNAVAEYYEPNTITRTTAGGLILELAGRVTSLLGPNAIESSRFFRDPLETLVRCRRFGDVVIVLTGIENRQYKVDKGTLLRLLFALEVTLRQQQEQHKQPTIDWEETAEVLEILNLADPYLWKTLTSLTSLSDVWNRKLDQQQQEEEEEEEEMGQDEEGDESSTHTLLPTRPSQEEPKTRRRRKRSLDSYTKRDELYIFRGWIYHSESPSEHEALPDITPQIEALYEGKDFRYSEELERSILQQNMDEEDWNDDLLYFDGDDGDSDDDEDDFFSDDEEVLDDDDDTDLDE